MYRPTAKYPWTDWLRAGKPVKVRRTRHFHCSVSSFKQQARNAARAMGLLLSIETVDEGVLLLSPRKRP